LEQLKSRIIGRCKSSKRKYYILSLKFYIIQSMVKAEIKKISSRPWLEDEAKLLKRFFPGGRAREIDVGSKWKFTQYHCGFAYNLEYNFRFFLRLLQACGGTWWHTQLESRKRLMSVSSCLEMAYVRTCFALGAGGRRFESYHPDSACSLGLLEAANNSIRIVAFPLGHQQRR